MSPSKNNLAAPVTWACALEPRQKTAPDNAIAANVTVCVGVFMGSVLPANDASASIDETYPARQCLERAMRGIVVQVKPATCGDSASPYWSRPHNHGR